MPSKGKPTVDQRKKNAQANDANSPDAYPTNDIRKRYVDAAKLLELRGDWPTRLAIKVFGPQLMGSITFAIDPTAKFQNSFRKVSPELRRVVHETKVTSFEYHIKGWQRSYQNYYVDDNTQYDEYLVEEVYVDEIRTLNDTNLRFETFLSDSTQKQRRPGQEFGTNEMLKDIESEYSTLPTIDVSDVDISYIENDPPYRLYEKQTFVGEITYDGPFAFPTGRWCDVDSVEQLRQTAENLANDKLLSLIPKCLANRRYFDSFYQLAELKDIRELKKGIEDFALFFERLAKDPGNALLKLDKVISNLYLSWEFGALSIAQAVKSLLKLPDKLAKRVNYLMAKNNKVSTGKFAISYTDDDWTYVSPNYSFDTPFGELVDVEAKVRTEIDVRCVVNQTITFPEIISPTFLDKNYRDLIGLQPRLIDLYNLVRFTWLIDWFAGLGDYINLMEAILSDKFLVNFGFLTVRFRSEFRASGKVVVSDRVTTFKGGDTEEVLTNTRSIKFFTRHSFLYSKRFSIADLSGSKTVDNKNGNLSDPQLSILGALISKYSKH